MAIDVERRDSPLAHFLNRAQHDRPPHSLTLAIRCDHHIEQKRVADVVRNDRCPRNQATSLVQADVVAE
jgi:hypothetical protein